MERSWREYWPLLLIPISLALAALALSFLDDEPIDPTWGPVEDIEFDYVYEGL